MDKKDLLVLFFFLLCFASKCSSTKDLQSQRSTGREGKGNHHFLSYINSLKLRVTLVNNTNDMYSVFIFQYSHYSQSSTLKMANARVQAP